MAKAMELGALRHSQGFDAYQILKEHEILGAFSLWPQDPTIANYMVIFTDPSWYTGYLNSIQYVVLKHWWSKGLALEEEDYLALGNRRAAAAKRPAAWTRELVTAGRQAAIVVTDTSTGASRLVSPEVAASDPLARELEERFRTSNGGIPVRLTVSRP